MAEKKKKILLIYPPFTVMNREDRCQQPIADLLGISAFPPMDLMYMAAVAEEIIKPCYYQAKISDYSLVDNPLEKFKKDLKDFSPDYLVINVASTNLEKDLSIIPIAKKICPNIITIAKGAHFLTENTDILYKHKSLDLVIVGEAEETLKEILQGKDYAKIKGLCYRDGFVAKYTGKRPFIKDLDKLSFPARHLINNNLFKSPDNGKAQAVIKVSRGCPHHCFFCLATPVSGSKVRTRSPENIVDEIQVCINNYGIKDFLFCSDDFNYDREWTLDLCEQIIDRELDITWSASVRADNIDEEVAEFMYDAGCRLVSMGAESGSQYILDKIGKKITINQIRDAVKILADSKIKVHNYFVIGLPWDNETTIEETIDFAIRLNSDFASFYTAVPLPGTRFHKFAMEHNLFNGKNSYEEAYCKPVIKTMCLSKDRVFELHKNALRRYYIRPGYMLKAISNIRSFSEFKNYAKAISKILLRR